MESSRPSEEINFSPEAIKVHLKPLAAVFIDYIKIRAHEKNGLDKLFDGDGRFVLEVKKNDGEETKHIIQTIISALNANIIQLSIKDTILKWQPELTLDSVKNLYIKIQHCYFSPISQGSEWQDFLEKENISSHANAGVLSKLKEAFCFWIILLFLQKMETSPENIILKNKANLLVKILNGTSDIPALVEEQKQSLLHKLAMEFQNIEAKLAREKHLKKSDLHTMLKENFEKVLTENWLPKKEKEEIAVQAMNVFMAKFKDRKEKVQQVIFAELFERLKSFMKSAETLSPSQSGMFGESSKRRHSGTDSATLNPASRPRAASQPPRPAAQLAVVAELSSKFQGKKL